MEGKMPNAGNKLVIEMAPWTNGDAIRAMTDEEMADYMPFVGKVNTGCPAMSINCQESCNKCWLDWLREEVTNK